jgi:hypothetical protein
MTAGAAVKLASGLFSKQIRLFSVRDETQFCSVLVRLTSKHPASVKVSILLHVLNVFPLLILQAQVVFALANVFENSILMGAHPEVELTIISI